MYISVTGSSFQKYPLAGREKKQNPQKYIRERIKYCLESQTLGEKETWFHTYTAK